MSKLAIVGVVLVCFVVVPWLPAFVVGFPPRATMTGFLLLSADSLGTGLAAVGFGAFGLFYRRHPLSGFSVGCAAATWLMHAGARDSGDGPTLAVAVTVTICLLILVQYLPKPAIAEAAADDAVDGREAALRREPASGASRVAATAEPVRTYDRQKWLALSDVDPEIRAAVAKVAPLGSSFEDELAEKFMALGDKAYLNAIVARVQEKYDEVRSPSQRP